MDGVVNEDDVLKENVTSTSRERAARRKSGTEKEIDIEKIEDKRSMNREMDAVYILSPQPHIVDCVMADLECRRYRRSYIIWTSCKNSKVEEEYASELRASRSVLTMTMCSAPS